MGFDEIRGGVFEGVDVEPLDVGDGLAGVKTLPVTIPYRDRRRQRRKSGDAIPIFCSEVKVCS